MPTKKSKGDDTQISLGAVMTPMLDVAFQVLAFFIMTYHPAALEGHIDGKLLPREDLAKADTIATDEPPPADKEPELKEEIIVEITSYQFKAGDNRKGFPKQISLKRGKASVQTDIIAEIDVLGTTYEEGLALLTDKLQVILEEGDRTSDQEITLKPDGDLNYEFVINAYDVCRDTKYETKEGGKTVTIRFKNVGFAPPDNVDED